MGDIVRIGLHSLAALTWIGFFGFSLGETPGRNGRIVAWAAFAVLVATGMWSVVAADVTAVSPMVQVLLLFKIALAISSAAAGAVAMVAGRERVRSAATVAALVLAVVAAMLGFVVAA